MLEQQPNVRPSFPYLLKNLNLNVVDVKERVAWLWKGVVSKRHWGGDIVVIGEIRRRDMVLVRHIS